IAEQMHQGRITVGEGEIQAYYDRNRSAFGERPLAEVKEQVRRIIVEQKERGFVQSYLAELRQRAGLQVDYGLLDVPEPSPPDVAAYYKANRDRFRIRARVRILQIQVSVSLAGNDQKAKARAETARARAVAGEDFAALARTLGDGPEKASDGAPAEPVTAGRRG
ncbi:MAG: peptidyl-prolyl cis-trans isomerase, partial [Actinobacteria bacterium]|nr:peptidyl-prolyl cis-trans isomerase [Actinomycetota bacterium]